MIVNYGVDHAVRLAGELEGSAEVVMDHAIFVTGGALVYISHATFHRAVPGNFSVLHFHLNFFVSADAFVCVGEGSDVLQFDADPCIVDIEAIVGRAHGGDIAYDNVGASDGDGTGPLLGRAIDTAYRRILVAGPVKVE